jgi:hypothetical protein
MSCSTNINQATEREREREKGHGIYLRALASQQTTLCPQLPCSAGARSSRGEGVLARGGRGPGRVHGLGVEVETWTMAGSGASRRCRAQSRSARVVVLVGWRRPVILVIHAAGPYLSI